MSDVSIRSGRPSPAGRRSRGSRRSSTRWWTTSVWLGCCSPRPTAATLSPFRHQIIEVAIAGMPTPSRSTADLRARLVAYAEVGALSELCLAWHQGSWQWNGRPWSTC